MEIAGKIALVTGAASGIGRATALALAHAGAAVVVGDLDEVGGAETVRQIAAAGGRAAFVRGDVATPDGVRALFAAAEQQFGGLDIVHNNAGIVSGSTPPWPETPLERIALLTSVNLAGVEMGTRAALDAFAKRGGGVVVNTASTAALGPMAMDPMYAASKAGVVLFTQSCKSLKDTHNVRVNAVLPGMVDTPIIQKTGDGQTPATWLRVNPARMLRPEQIAAAVLDFVRDDTLAGETRVVANPPAPAAP